MAPSSSSFPSSSTSPPSAPYQSPRFTPIQECDKEEHDEGMYSVEESQSRGRQSGSTDKGVTPKHHPTPLHETHKSGKANCNKNSDSVSAATGEDGSVSCNRCRPHAREKITVVPLDNNGPNKNSSSIASPNGIFKSIFSSLTRKSPRSAETLTTAREEQWKIAVAELSHKLIQATRKRDEALLEASRLKHTMAELEKKLNKLEVYCHNLKSGLEECSTNSPYQMGKSLFNQQLKGHSSLGLNHKVIEHFLVSVSEARSSVRLLCRSLTMQLRQVGGKVHERISVLLQPFDIKVSLSKNPRSLLFYLEALLNKAFYEDFESVGFQKNASNQILNPIDRCDANFEAFNLLQGLTWEDVLSKGTRHFSEEFSRFCDRKMSEIVAMLGWNRAWPEPLLQAFFGASKSVWLLHLLASSVHPSLPIFRVDKEVGFDGAYMEDMGGDKVRGLVPSVVRIMVAPGFYVYGSVVKCKVLCSMQRLGPAMAWNVFKCCTALRGLGSIMILLVLAVVGVSYYTMVIAIYGPALFQTGLPDLLLALSVLLLFHGLLAMLLWSYFSVVLTNPGSVPPNWRPVMDEEKGDTDPLMSSEYNGPSLGLNQSPMDSANPRTRFCRKCNQFKPPRCHHCSVCGRCVLKMDHHCVWVVNCVGAFNYKYFFLFLFYTFLETTLVTLSLLPYFIMFFTEGEIPGTAGTLASTLITFILNLSFALSVLGFLIMHISLMGANTTTIEAYEKKTTRVWHYDLGWKENFQQVFGMNKKYWLIPAYAEEDLRLMPALQGLEYPTKHDLDVLQRF